MRDNYSIKLNILKKLLFLHLFALSSGALLTQKNYTIRGFVYNSDNGEAESYVKVLLKPIVINQSSEINGALTDLDGFFQFNSMPAGDYVLEIRSLEHEDITDTLKIGDKEITTLRYELRSEEHTSELQSRPHLVCRLLLEK